MDGGEAHISTTEHNTNVPYLWGNCLQKAEEQPHQRQLPNASCGCNKQFHPLPHQPGRILNSILSDGADIAPRSLLIGQVVKPMLNLTPTAMEGPGWVKGQFPFQLGLVAVKGSAAHTYLHTRSQSRNCNCSSSNFPLLQVAPMHLPREPGVQHFRGNCPLPSHHCGILVGRKRGRETSMCGCLSHTSHQGPGLQPRHVP